MSSDEVDLLGISSIEDPRMTKILMKLKKNYEENTEKDLALFQDTRVEFLYLFKKLNETLEENNSLRKELEDLKKRIGLIEGFLPD